MKTKDHNTPDSEKNLEPAAPPAKHQSADAASFDFARDDDKGGKKFNLKINTTAPLGDRTQRVWIPLAIFIISLGVYMMVSGNRLWHPSSDNHYVYLANNLLHGRLSLKGSPPHQNDWSLITELTLKDGRKVRGTFLQTGGTGWFKTTRGERLLIQNSDIRSRHYVYYVSFPWFPSILMLPFVAIWGLKFSDVLFTAIFAAFNPVLVYFVLRRLALLKLSDRSLSEDLWLVLCFAFGTVHFFSSVMGQVWYTAHVIGVGLTCLYVLAALEGRHPLLAGLCLGLGFVTRTPIPFAFPLALGEILRISLKKNGEVLPKDPCHRPPIIAWVRSLLPRVEWKKAIPKTFIMGLPMVAIFAVACLLNFLRFDTPFEFGHYYLNVRWATRIQRWGLFNYHFLTKNLTALFFLTPRIFTRPPYVQVSWHGLSIFLTTPIFAFLLWPRKRSPIQPWLYLSVLFPMILHLLYQNTGWVQFGYRFSLDYTVFLIALLAIGGYRLGPFAKVLILFGVAVNTFGAITFNRDWQFYWDGIFPAD